MSPPRADELEVSVFGPGVGECVVVHLGAGEWLVVDSCLDRETKQPVALTYLHSLGVDVGMISMVVVTHWHDDHMAGAAQVVRAAASAKFFCSAALNNNEFCQLVASTEDAMLTSASSGGSEFAQILAELQARRQPYQRMSSVGPNWAVQNQTLRQRAQSASMPAATVVCMAPSAAAQTRGWLGLGAFLPRVGEAKRAAVSLGPNDASVVLGVQVGAATALLGADLETGADPSTGWKAVIGQRTVIQPMGQVFKVAHHGSKNAHHDAVWSTLLTTDPVAVLTPFNRASLPTAADVERLKGRTPEVYVTSRMRASAMIPNKAVARTVKETARTFRPVTGAMGHVRVRISANGGPATIERFGAAYAA